MERDTVANPLLQTLSLISGYGQFRFEFTYTDYYREYTEVNFSTKNRFFFPQFNAWSEALAFRYILATECAIGAL